jgi:hypothetical protein
MAKHFVDRMMVAMMTGTPWNMARASYAYSRAHGLTVYEALVGAVELYFIYRKKAGTP